MSLHWQARILLVFGALCFLGASYKAFDVIQWQVRKVEATGTITAIDGHSAEHKPGPRGACLQTLHYVFMGSDQRTYQGKEKVWFGDCRLRTGSPLIVYVDRNDPARSITGTGFKSRRHWAIMLAIWSLIGVVVGGFVQAFNGSRFRDAAGLD
jgi:hypothetical protein